MAYITLNAERLEHNYKNLKKLFRGKDIKWAVVTKVLCGNRRYLEELVTMGVQQVCDSRVSNLKVIKKLNPEIETIYIKPPAKHVIPGVVQVADISMNTSLETIEMLNDEAKKQGKTHGIIIMIEMGELREGVMRDDLIDFYSKVFELSHIEVVGIGTNLSCLYGVLPSDDKLIQLSLYEQLIEAKFNKTIPYVSGGSSVTIPLMLQGILPTGVNHFRVGESLFLGTNPYDNKVIEGLHDDVFKLSAQVIELIQKPIVPTGEMGQNVEGETFVFDEEDLGKTSFRAIIDIGLLDVETEHIIPVDEKLSIAGASSDMVVIDLAQNEQGYEVGSDIEFRLDYMGVLRILNSRYIEKRVECSIKERVAKASPRL